MIEVRDTPSGATFAVKVHPRARKNAIAGELNGVLKLALTAPPMGGKANQACIEFLAALLRVPRSSVTIACGHGGRRKVIRVAELTAEMARGRLGAQRLRQGQDALATAGGACPELVEGTPALQLKSLDPF